MWPGTSLRPLQVPCQLEKNRQTIEIQQKNESDMQADKNEMPKN
jgi:hypothetical protein